MFGYIFPALGGLFVTYLYNVVDGIYHDPSTFSVQSYISSLANAILSGVAQGLQPLWGQCYGRKDTEEMNWFFRSGMVINTIFSVTIFGILFIFDVPVIHIFNKEPELVQTATAALPLFAMSFIPMAYNLIYTAFLFSTKRTGAICIAPFVAETVTLLIAIGLKRTSKLVYQ